MATSGLVFFANLLEVCQHLAFEAGELVGIEIELRQV